MSELTFVIPAAGIGKRMQSLLPGVPKALIPLCGRPMIDHIIDTILATGFNFSIVVVVNPKFERSFRNALKGRAVNFAVQERSLGTGDALRAAQPATSDATSAIVVMFADQPLLSATSISRLVTAHRQSDAAVTMAIVRLKDFLQWRSAFYDWGRIIRDGSGKIVGVVEARDATQSQLVLTEVNPSLYCFKVPWIWDGLSELRVENEQHEYLLTDIVSIAARKKLPIETVVIDNPYEMIGANSPEQFRILQRLYHQRPNIQEE